METDPDLPPVRIVLPKDDFKIGETPDGQDIFIDPKEFILSEDEKLETKENISKTQRDAAVHKLALVALANAEQFFKQVIVATANEEGRNLLTRSMDGTIESNQALMEWVERAGYSCIQDGLETVVKVKGKVVRQMTANPHRDLALDVAKRIMQLVKQQ